MATNPVWKRRIEEAKTKDPCSVRCLRCLRRLARGEPYEAENDCKFATSDLLIAEYVHEGTQCNVCLYCLTKNNKDCFKVRYGLFWRTPARTDLMSEQPDASTLNFVEAVDAAIKSFLQAGPDTNKTELAKDIQAAAQIAIEWTQTCVLVHYGAFRR